MGYDESKAQAKRDELEALVVSRFQSQAKLLELSLKRTTHTTPV